MIPGGGQPLRPGNSFFDAVHYLTRLAKEANAAGDHFPVSDGCSSRAQHSSARLALRMTVHGVPACTCTFARHLTCSEAHSCPLQVHGTCLGFEAMACDVAGTDKILTRCARSLKTAQGLG